MLRSRSLRSGSVFIGLCLGSAFAQPSSNANSLSAVRKGAALAQSGQCVQALPILQKNLRQIAADDLKRRASLAGVRCAMTLGRPDAALEFLQIATHDFPADPDVLYTEVHAFSDLSTHASQQLGLKAGDSPQAHELLAESYESQGKWDEAAKQYRLILEKNPDFPGIHFRLGRLLLSKPNPSADVAQQAKHEFEEELRIDPSNAGAEYVLGELARQNQQWDEAESHFSHAAKLDPHFAEAFIGLGITLLSEKKYTDAVAPLQTAVNLEPGNPDAHYNLAMAYTRAGRKEEGQREFAIHRQLIKNDGGAVQTNSNSASQ